MKKACDKCSSTVNLFISLPMDNPLPIPDSTPVRCGFCLEDDDSTTTGGEWDKLNSVKNRGEFKRGEQL